MCVWGGAVKNNTALHEILSGKLKRKQSSLKPFAVWIFLWRLLPIRIFESIHNGVPWLLRQ